MTWPAVILLALAYLAVTLRIAYWIGGLLRDAEVFFREPCRCAHCPRCLSESEAIRVKAGGSA
jgi:hypothetical protein